MTRFDNFLNLDPAAADLARGLIAAPEQQQLVFSSFIHVWMAFNGWMECVTEAGSDREMIDALASHARLKAAYDHLLASGTEFRASVVRLADLMPVLSVRDVRKKLGRDAFQMLGRPQILHEARRAHVKRPPAGWASGAMPTWPQLLRTIYQVRCNLFHGSKSPDDQRDQELVETCNTILRQFITRTNCFGWSD